MIVFGAIITLSSVFDPFSAVAAWGVWGLAAWGALALIWLGGIAAWVVHQKRRERRREAAMTEEQREQRLAAALADFRKLIDEE